MSEAIWSSTAPVTNTIRSRSRREKMSKLRSPRFDCSMTMGTSALSGSGILSCMRLFLLFIVVLPLHRVKCARLQEDSRSEEHTSELQSLMRISYAVFCLKKQKKVYKNYPITSRH